MFSAQQGLQYPFIFLQERVEASITAALLVMGWSTQAAGILGEAGADQRGAIIYTVVESCRRRGQDPYTYLRDVLTRLPHMTNHQFPTVTPQAWCKARRQLQRVS
jgi:hypothetical protein